MAGLATTMTRESLREGSWYRCSDGRFIEALDIVHLIFPNKGRNTTSSNVCFVPDHFEFSPLRNFLPNETNYFVPDDFVDCVASLFCLCFFVTIGMIVAKYIWEWIDPQFAIISEHKKWYVLAYMSKTFFLACIAFSTWVWIGTYSLLMKDMKDNLSSLQLKRTSMIYIASDIVALYMVTKLPWRAKIHHFLTAVVCLAISIVNITLGGWTGPIGVVKMVTLSGFMFAVTFPVNAYLALRIAYPKAKWLKWLVTFSLWAEIVVCVISWTTRIIWIVMLVTSWEISVYNIVYCFTITVVDYTQANLIKWLWKRSSAHEAQKELP